MAKKHSQPESAHTAPAAGDKAGGTAVSRAGLLARMPRISRRKTIGFGVVVLFLIGNGIVLWIWLPALSKSEPLSSAKMLQALAALDRHSLNDAKHLAMSLKQSAQLDSSDRGGPLFVLGAVEAETAEQLPEAEQQAAFQSAARLLEDARQRGFPAGRQAQGMWLLGKCLYLSGDYVASRAALEEAVQDNRQADPAAFAMLAEAYFRGADPNDHKARDYIDRYLSTPSLNADMRDSAELLKARILDRLQDQPGSEKALAQIPESAACYPSVLEFQAQQLIHQAHAPSNPASKQLYQQAIEKLQAAQSRSSSGSALALRCMYWTGICLAESGQAQAALDQFQLVRNSSVHSDEALAAMFHSAELLQQQGHEEAAISIYRQVVQSIGDVAAYHNEYLSVDEVRKQMLAVYEQYLRAAKFDPAAQLSRLLHPLFPREGDLELQGDLLQAAAKSYFAKAEGAPADQAKVLSAKARANLRQAGQAFFRLAELHTARRSYSDELWSAAECFFQGHDYQHTVVALELYIKNEVRRRRAAALQLLGESRMALGQTDQGLAALKECIDAYAADPASYRARLLVAKAAQAKGDDAKAEELLRQNLEDGTLTPRSIEWHDSLFALASLMEMAGRYQEAIPRLEEAVARYPDAPQTIEARYLTAESYPRLALEAQKKIADDKIETARAAHTKQMRDDLTAALAQFEQIQSLLTRDRPNDPSPLDKAVLRNCYFGRGSALYELGRWDDAIRVYLSAANTYRNEPESLEALSQVAACYRQMNRPVEARGAIAQAKAALARINKDANFTLTTNYNRDEWGRVFDQMATM